jgi:peptide-methionine (S)-S-oxide reductase
MGIRGLRSLWLPACMLPIALLIAVVLAAPAGARDEAGQAGEAEQDLATAVFAGGCFWCMEPPFDELEGVVSTTSGYIGGDVANPRYEQVAAGGTGHAEAVKIVYRPSQIGYETLLDVFWKNIDPLDGEGQFCDRGDQYRSGIFYGDDEQRQIAEQSKERLKQSARFAEPIVTAIVPASEFYPAEDYHQDYYRKNPLRYKLYRYGCGRDRRLQELWGSSFAGR